MEIIYQYGYWASNWSAMFSSIICGFIGLGALIVFIGDIKKHKIKDWILGVLLIPFTLIFSLAWGYIVLFDPIVEYDVKVKDIQMLDESKYKVLDYKGYGVFKVMILK